MNGSLTAKIFHFFTVNDSIRQTLVKNSVWLMFSQGLTGLWTFLIGVILANKFGSEGSGIFAYAISFVSVFSTLFDFGISMAVTREFARNPELGRNLPAVFVCKFLIGLVASVIVVLAAIFFTPDMLTRKCVYALAAYIFSSEMLFLLYAAFRAEQKMELESILRGAGVFVLAGAVFFVLRYYPTIFNVCLAYAISTAAVLAAGVIILPVSHNGKFNLMPVNLTVWKGFLAIGWYLALSRGIGEIITYIDSVMLGSMNMLNEAGWYNAAMRIARMILFPMVFITTAAFPAMVAMIDKSPDKFNIMCKLWSKLNVFLAGLLLSVGFACSREIIIALYPQEFVAAINCLNLLMIMAGLVYLHNLYYHILLAYNKQKQIFGVLLLSGLVNVIMNYILIRTYKHNGAAAAAVATHFITLCCYITMVHFKTHFKPVAEHFQRDLICAAAASPAAYWICRLPGVWYFGLGGVLFAGAVVFFAVFLLMDLFVLGNLPGGSTLKYLKRDSNGL